MSNTEPLQILIVDDDEDDFFITSEYIKSIPFRTSQLDWAYNYNDALTRLKSNNYDLNLVDYRFGA